MSYKDPNDPRIKRSRREYYYRNKRIEKARIQKRSQEIKDWFKNYKENLSCTQCSESHPACLDFHHERTKDKGVAQAVHNGWSKERILEEIAKCTVLCSNCHRKLHYGSRWDGIESPKLD